MQGDNREGLLACLLECDIIVYHIIESSSQNEEAMWAAQGKLNYSHYNCY